MIILIMKTPCYITITSFEQIFLHNQSLIRFSKNVPVHIATCCLLFFTHLFLVFLFFMLSLLLKVHDVYEVFYIIMGIFISLCLQFYGVSLQAIIDIFIYSHQNRYLSFTFCPLNSPDDFVKFFPSRFVGRLTKQIPVFRKLRFYKPDNMYLDITVVMAKHSVIIVNITSLFTEYDKNF